MQRPTQNEEALRPAAVELTEEGEPTFCLDAFGGHAQTERCGYRQDRRDQRGVVRIAGQPVDERFVDRDGVVNLAR